MAEVSIIVPVYNVEKYLHQCVDSILQQTFKDFELILVDDGSPDNCGKICDEYAAKDSRVTVIHKANGGVSSARNAGLDVATGKYIMFCDSDDYVAKTWCEQMLYAAMKYPQSLITSDLSKVTENDKICMEKYIGACATEASFDQIVLKGLSGYVCNKIFRNDIIQCNNLRFDINRDLGEDVLFVMEYCTRCHSFVLVDAPLYYYIQREGSSTHTPRFDILEHQLFTFYLRIPFLSKEEIPDFCDGHLYSFIHYFDAVFHSRNKMSYLEKLRYNHRMLQSEPFRFCLEQATGTKENPVVMRILRTHNYYLFWLFMLLVKLKQTFRRKK